MITQYKEYLYSDGENPSGLDGQRLADKLIAQLSKIEGVTDVYDVGCGNGYLTHRLGKAGYNAVGVDASVSGINVARRTYGESLKFICANISADNPVEQLVPNSCDAVVSSEVIEHLYRPADLIDMAKWLLRPGGWLVLTTPYHGYMKYLTLAVLGLMDNHLNSLWDGGHIKFFSIRTLSKLLESHGMRVKTFTFYGRFPFLWKSMICTAKLHSDTARHRVEV